MRLAEFLMQPPHTCGLAETLRRQSPVDLQLNDPSLAAAAVAAGVDCLDRLG